MNSPFHYSPSPDLLRAYSEMFQWDIMRHPPFRDEIEKGKMFGILLVKDADGVVSSLAAFSGQIADSFHWQGFVPPIFDYLDEDGYFKVHEREISALNRVISEIENHEYASLLREYETLKAETDNAIEVALRRMAEAKTIRDARRKEGVSQEEETLLIRESQYLKAELHRCKLAARQQLAPILERIDECKARISGLIEKRRRMSENLQRWLFSNFRMLNAEGESKDLNTIFVEYNGIVPPSGSGECCAPKLLQYAYLHDLQPLEIAEFWHGESPRGEVRYHGAHYPACHSKCLPILGWMMRGLDVDQSPSSSLPGELMPEIIYENERFCVVNKPSGLLSVPGKSDAPSVVSLLRKHYGRDVFPAHRLDRDTSGLLLLAFDVRTQSRFHRMFEMRLVKKTYIAVLDGDISVTSHPLEGRISLPLAPDLNDRPRQMVDIYMTNGGKDALTDYRVVQVKDGLTHIEFHPLTGRTHQLRLHAASPLGLGMPIVGDKLYYRNNRTPCSRMLLHASAISFSFNGTPYSFTSNPDFPKK